LEQFWSGEAWRSTRNPEAVAFAYIFSERLTKDIRALGEADFKRFLNTADARDAGEAACQQVYGFGLQVWVQKLLGAGDWTPEGNFPTSETMLAQVETASAAAAATSSASRFIFQRT
jgi:elongation factor P--beta-lysine ligase